MSANLRRYRAIHKALIQGYPDVPQGNVVRHVTTLAALISGMVGSPRTQFPNMATQVPNGTKPESRIKRFARWVDHATITEEVSVVPYAAVWLCHRAWQTWVVVMDGSVVGRGCVALLMHVVYPRRALPLVWQGRKGQQGPWPEAMHLPEKSWLPSAAIASGRPHASQAFIDGGLLGLHLDHLSRCAV